MTPIRKVGIIGTGQMGSGIAHVVALSGYEVLLSDLSKERVDKGLEAIGKNLSRQIASGKITEEESKQALARISYAESYQDLADADLVIEAATEDETVKRKIFVALCPFLKADAIVATNTSSISITRLAAATDRPERFIGLHFMNPVPVMELVEMIRGIATEDVTFVRAREFVETLGKTTAVSEDFPAFMVNRVLLPMINEAVYTLYEGVGSVDAIDTAIRLGAHHPMGPLQLADFIGLDTCLSIMQVLYEGLADSKYRPCPLLVKYVEAGWLGRKTKRGFYDYRGEKPMPTRGAARRPDRCAEPRAPAVALLRASGGHAGGKFPAPRPHYLAARRASHGGACLAAERAGRGCRAPLHQPALGFSVRRGPLRQRQGQVRRALGPWSEPIAKSSRVSPCSSPSTTPIR